MINMSNDFTSTNPVLNSDVNLSANSDSEWTVVRLSLMRSPPNGSFDKLASNPSPPRCILSALRRFLPSFALITNPEHTHQSS